MTAETKCAAWDVVVDRRAAMGYIAGVCFKTGPPRRLGVELEWTVHRENDPAAPISAADLRMTLGAHAPKTVDPAGPHLPLAHGGVVTVEPGGQVEISTPASRSLSRLLHDTAREIAQLRRLLATGGLSLGDSGCDPHRPPRRIIESPRYQAMQRAFDAIGPAGNIMMCSTASVQVCLDIGQTLPRAVARWNTLHAIGPALIALFANSRRRAGRDTGWACSRMHTWHNTDPARTGPPSPAEDAVAQWGCRVLDTPLLCLRRRDGCWEAPAGMTFGDWIDGALDEPPTFDDLDYHLSTLFPPVRARGHFEVRYLDAQPGEDWMLPVAMLAALFAREDTADAALELAQPAAHLWVAAARDALADPRLAAVAAALTELACKALPDTDLSPPTIRDLTRRLRVKAGGDL